jgi:hypothetical protein
MRAWACLAIAVTVMSLAATGPTSADWCPTYTAYPGWEILSCEDAYVNPALPDGTRRYPLSNLVDGDPRTVWVFEGIKWDGKERSDGYRPWKVNHPFRGGLHQWVAVQCLAEEPPFVDAVGIINGYAKDAATYQRNNRISRLRLQVARTWFSEPTWSKTVQLSHTLQTQVIAIPRQRAGFVSFLVEGVEQGKDNGLCISEVQLFYRGRPLVERPTPYVVYSPGDECGCGLTYFLVDRAGAPVLAGSPARPVRGNTYRFPAAGKQVVFVQEYENAQVIVADLESGKQVRHLPLPAQASFVEWAGDSKLYCAVSSASKSRYYLLDFSKPGNRAQPIAQIPPAR